MNSSPETLTPVENLPLKPGSPNLTENHEHPALDPERILDALKKRAESAVTKEEREKFQRLADKLSATLVSKSEQAVDGTKDAWTKLRSEISPEQKKILQDAETALKTSTAKLEDVARSTIAKSQEIGGQAIEAARTGNVTELKKLAADVEETVNEAGQKVMKYSGAKAFEKMMEPLKTQGIAGIFAVIMNFWKFLTGGMKWSEVVEGAQTQAAGAVAAGTATAQTAAGRAREAFSRWAQEAQQFLLDKEYRNWLIEKSLPSMYDKLSKEFFEGGNLSQKQKDNLREILQNAHYGQDTVAKIKDRIEKWNLDLAKASDLSDLFLEVGFWNINILWELMSRGVIPMSRIAVHTFEAGANSYRFNVGVVFERLHLPNPPLISLSSEELAEKMKQADPKLKEFLLVEMYRVNGFMAGILGTMAASSASLMNAILVDTSTGVDGIRMFQANFSGKYDALLKDISILEKAVLTQNVGWVESQVWQALRDHFAQIKQNFSVLAQLKADPTNLALKNQVKMLADPFKLKNSVGQLLGTKAGIASEYLDSLYEIQKYQVAVAQKDILSRARWLFGSFEILKMPRMADRFMLHFPSPEAAQKTLQQMAAYGPEFLHSFFRSLPVAGLVIAGYDVANSSDAKNNSVASFLGEASKVLIPFVWPLALFFSDTHGPKITSNKESGNLEIENMGTGFLAAGMLGVDSVMLVNAIRSGKLMQFATWRIVDVAKFGGDIVKYGRVGLRSVEKLAPQIGKLMPMIQALPKKLRIAAIFAITLWWSAYAYAKSHTDIEQQLIKDGFWDVRTENVTSKLMEQFWKMNADEKRVFIDGLYVTFIESKESKLPETQSHYEKGIYTLVVGKNEDMPKIWESLNTYDSKFGEELRALWIGLKVASSQVPEKK